MAQLHYIIDSREKVRINKKAHNNFGIVIENVVMLEENHRMRIDGGVLIDDNKNRVKENTRVEIITYILYSVAIMLLLALFILLGVGKDCNILNSSYIDNTIGIAALLFGLVSISRVKEFLSKILGGPQICNKCWYVLMILCLPFYIVLFMNWIGLQNSVSNICGIIGIIISICTW